MAALILSLVFLKEKSSVHLSDVISGAIYAIWPRDDGPTTGKTYILRNDNISAPIS
jgi:hypothetical protein|tara:strand:- start:522 stop:689 length:168 start_codon:yes stop_codon:yes gene_type:complete